ncbi:MAG: PadR family transcriptional regulator [Roseivirga sp.]|nr:PadR family transcriptional regulator [Roseivirga sp.]
MSHSQLPEFEKIVLLTVAVLQHDAYGVTILEGIEERLAKPVNVGLLQVALKRLEDKGYLKSHLGEATSERGGRRKRFFTVTNFGRTISKTFKEQQIEHWHSFQAVVLASAKRCLWWIFVLKIDVYSSGECFVFRWMFVSHKHLALP